MNGAAGATLGFSFASFAPVGAELIVLTSTPVSGFGVVDLFTTFLTLLFRALFFGCRVGLLVTVTTLDLLIFDCCVTELSFLTFSFAVGVVVFLTTTGTSFSSVLRLLLLLLEVLLSLV